MPKNNSTVQPLSAVHIIKENDTHPPSHSSHITLCLLRLEPTCVYPHLFVPFSPSFPPSIEAFFFSNFFFNEKGEKNNDIHTNAANLNWY